MKQAMVILVLILLCGAWLHAQTAFELQKLVASDGTPSSYFGQSVAMDGDYAVVGSPYGDGIVEDSGTAYIFHWNGSTWEEQAELVPLTGLVNDKYGSTVDISGDFALVGCPEDDTMASNAGCGYVFQRSGTTWTQVAKLMAPDGSMADYLGYSVGISGDYAILGAYGDDIFSQTSGSAYIYHWNGSAWALDSKLIPNDGASNDSFGCSVSISGSYALIGAKGDDDLGDSSGSAYIFYLDGGEWTQQAKIEGLDTTTGDSFGLAVDIDGDYAIVGAYADADNGYNSGSAYIFHRNGSVWAQQAKLLAYDGAANDFYGWSLTIGGNYAVIGARQDDDTAGTSGSAYLYRREGTAWNLQDKLHASDAADSDQFGYSMAIDDGRIIVGSVYDDDLGNFSGSCYAFGLMFPITAAGDIFISEVSDNLPAQPQSTGYIELYNISTTMYDMSGCTLEQGNEVAGVFTPSVPAVQFTFPADTPILGRGYLIVSNGADEAIFKTAWGIAEDIRFVQGTSALDITNGYAYQLNPPVTRAELDHTPDVAADGQVVQMEVGNWSSGTPSESTPGGGSGGQTLPVTLSSFTATQSAGCCVALAWIAESETDLSGYNVYRSQTESSSDAWLLNDGIIAAAGAHGAYSFEDTDVQPQSSYRYWLQAVGMDGRSAFFGPVQVSITDEPGEGNDTPDVQITALQGCYPNPFNPSTTVLFTLAQQSDVRLDVFNMRGQRVATLLQDTLPAGSHRAVWNGQDAQGHPLGCGVYFIRLHTGDTTHTHKVMLLK